MAYEAVIKPSKGSGSLHLNMFLYFSTPPKKNPPPLTTKTLKGKEPEFGFIISVMALLLPIFNICYIFIILRKIWGIESHLNGSGKQQGGVCVLSWFSSQCHFIVLLTFSQFSVNSLWKYLKMCPEMCLLNDCKRTQVENTSN